MTDTGLNVIKRGKFIAQDHQIIKHKPGLLHRFGIHWFCKDVPCKHIDFLFTDDRKISVGFTLSKTDEHWQIRS